MVQGTARLRDETLLRRILAELGDEAVEYRFEVAPNPCVGAALFAGEREVARGFHRVWGGPHAEVDCLRAAGERARDADTLVVTLEPCSSDGKTPPCVDAILAAGLSRVVVGAEDPDPRHRGRGLALLREAGLEVLLLADAAPPERVSPHFAAWLAHDRVRRPRPWTIAKWAQTRTGQLVPPANFGEGRWISSPESRAEVQRLRGRVDAIVTGVGTVLADDPRLTVRGPAAEEEGASAPLRVVLDSYLRTPPFAALFAPAAAGELAGEVHLLGLAGSDVRRHTDLLAAGAQVHGMHAIDDRLVLREVQQWLWERGVRRVLLECGPTLLAAHLELGFVDQVRIYTGSVNGGQGASMGEWLSRARLSERHYREAGDDAVLEAFIEPDGP